MADPTVDRYPKDSAQDGSLIEVIWNLTTADPTGEPIRFGEWADRSWHIGFPTPGSSVCAIQAGVVNDGLATGNFAAVEDAHGGGDIEATATQNYTSIQIHKFMRPHLIDVGVGAVVKVTLTARRNNDLRQ